MTEPVSVVLAGAHGYGSTHLRALHRLERQGTVRLSGVCDTREPTAELRALAGPAPWTDDLGTLLDARPQIVVVCTPIHTHAGLAERALRSGADVLLEKPPAATLAEFRRLSDVQAATGRDCQVGFQCLASSAVDEIRRLAADGAIGRVRGIGVFGASRRDAAYWQRAPWAGRRTLGGRPVGDGAVTNPFAHAVAAALRIDGSDRLGDLAEVETELFRANPIEADDTSCVRIRTRTGTTIVVGVTLCAAAEREPYVVVHGEGGRAVYRYLTHRLRVVTPDRTTETVHTVADPLTDLVRHVRDRAHPLAVPLARTGAFMEVAEAIRVAPAPAEIPDRYRRVSGTGTRRRQVVIGATRLARLAATRLETFSELGAPWAAPVGATR
jgi:predicted dehydrogenase